MKKFLLLVAAAIACTMGMAAQETLTVCDGSATNNYIPINSLWWDDANTNAQTIFPAALLQDMEGTKITAIKFYISGNGVAFSGGKCNLMMGTTEQDAFASATAIEGLTVVAADVTAPESGSTEIEFEFDTPFEYNGGNLVFGCQMTQAGGYGSSYFYGESQTTNTAFSRSSTYNFLPKTTFTYEAEQTEYGAKVTPSALDFGKLNPGQSKVLNITVKNRGLNAFTPAVTTAAPFSAQYDGAALASGESVEIPVTYAPTALGEFAGELSVNCGEAGTYTVALTGLCTDIAELVVCDGTVTNSYVPFYGSYFDSDSTMTQMIYPAEMLTDIKGIEIIGVQFESKYNLSFPDGQLLLSLGETETTEFTVANDVVENPVTGLTPMASVTPASTILEFTFDNPYTYQGGNLAVETLVTEATSKYSSTTFLGVATENNASFYAYKWNNASHANAQKFLPKMTILYRIATADETVTVTGVVTDTDQQPLEGVNVTLTVNTEVEGAPRTAAEPQTHTATTDATGAYTIEMTPVEGATIDMTFVKDGYKTVTLNDVDIEDEVNVTMEADDLTGIENIEAEGGKVTYVNPLGQTSDRPFQGVNIVVQGGKAIGKVIK